MAAIDKLGWATGISDLSAKVNRRLIQSTKVETEVNQSVRVHRQDASRSVVSLRTPTQTDDAAMALPVENGQVKENALTVQPDNNQMVDPVTSTAIRWQYADQGSYMCRSASKNRQDVEFARESYIDGIVYLLRALPENLGVGEEDKIQQALPRFTGPREGDFDGFNGVRRRTRSNLQRLQRPTLVHRVTSSVVAFLVVIIYALFAYTLSLICIGIRYDREHNISGRIVTRGFVAVAALGNYSVGCSGKILDMRRDHGMTSLAVRTLRSVAAGIQEGIGRGMLIIEQRQE